MAHEVEAMAYVQETPWHGLGIKLTEGQPLEVWTREAGMEWDIRETPVHFLPNNGEFVKVEGQKVLFRSDTEAPLSVVSDRYKPVQPREVLDFYKDLVSAGGFELETAGVLKGGRKLWALARTGQEAVLRGGDRVRAYLLLATACDGSLATTAQYTSVRVVCNNTLQMAVGNTTGAIRVPHTVKFDAQAVKDELGLGFSAWDTFKQSIHALAARTVSPAEAQAYLANVLGDSTLPLDEQPRERLLKSVYDLYAGEAVGSDLQAANGTAWGLLNSVTEYLDHHRRERVTGGRLHSAWFGQGAAVKKHALDEALKLAA